MRERWWMILVFLALALSSCAPDPRSVAEADATRIRAAQDAADREAARKQAQAQFDLEQRQREAQAAQWVKSWNTFVAYAMLFLTIGVSVVLMGVSVGVGVGAVGMGRAAANYAWVRSNLIQLDRNTRQFPLMLQHVGHGRFTLTDMNTGLVQALDVRVAGDRQMIAAANTVRLSGAVAEMARQHASDPAGVALVGTNPVVVDGMPTADQIFKNFTMVGGKDGSTD